MSFLANGETQIDCNYWPEMSPSETEWTIATLKEYWETIHKKDLEALRLQAAEYERRLSALNNEYDRIAKAQSTYVSYSVLITIISIGIAGAALFLHH